MDGSTGPAVMPALTVQLSTASSTDCGLLSPDPCSAVGEGRGRQLDCQCRHHRWSVATVNQQSRQNLGPRLYSKGDLGNRESKREILRSAIGGTARFEKDLCATVPPSRR